MSIIRRVNLIYRTQPQCSVVSVYYRVMRIDYAGMVSATYSRSRSAIIPWPGESNLLIWIGLGRLRLSILARFPIVAVAVAGVVGVVDVVVSCGGRDTRRHHSKRRPRQCLHVALGILTGSFSSYPPPSSIQTAT